jgi:hypothetical protein
MMRTVLAATIAAIALVTLPAAHASADADTCRAAGSEWLSNTGQRCRGLDADQWHIGGNTQLFCWYYPTVGICRD